MVSLISICFPEVVDGRDDRGVELTWFLEWREMTDSLQKVIPRIRNALGQVFRVFSLDEFVVFSLRDDDRNVNGSQIVERIVRLGSLHQADVFEKCRELVRRRGQFGIVLCMPAKAALKQGTRIERILCTTGIHVAGEIEDSRNPRGLCGREDQGCACTVAPSDKRRRFDSQVIQHCRYIRRQQFIRIRPRVPRAASVAAGVHNDRPVSIFQ
jgi:hypothetical protein